MASSTLELIALSITKSKNPSIFMVSTAKGMFSVRKNMLDKRGIVVGDEGYKFPTPTVVVIENNKKGDYIFGYNENGQPNTAPEDSSRLNPETGEPVYKKGSTPVWETDISVVRSFVGFEEWRAQKQMEKLVKELA